MESTKKFLIVAAFCLTLASWCASFAIKRPCHLVPATLAPACTIPTPIVEFTVASRGFQRVSLLSHTNRRGQEEIWHGVGAS